MMKKIFANDSVLKVFSFIVSIVIWMYIILIVDPSVDINIKDIPVKYINQAALTEQGLSIVNESSATVDIKLRGSRNKFANIDSKNIVATVDLSTVAKIGTHSLPVKINIPYEYDEILSKKPYNVNVTVDKIIEARKSIRISTTGSLENGYISGDTKITPSSIVIKGASSVVDQIADIYVHLDYAESNKDISEKLNIIMLDPSGKAISEDSDIYKHIIKDVDFVNVYCPVMKLKTVPVKVTFTELEQQNPDITNMKITALPNTVTIYAKEDVLDSIDEVETENIDISNAETVKEYSTKLKLPEGVGIRDDVNIITVKVDFK